MDRALEGIAIHLWALSVESYLRKDPGLVCCVGERKTYTESSPCKIGSRLSAVEDFGSSDTHPQVRTFYFYSAFFLICFNGKGGSVVKNQPANGGEAGSIPGLERSSGGGNGNPLQYSYLDRGAWQARVRGVTESDTTE